MDNKKRKLDSHDSTPMSKRRRVTQDDASSNPDAELDWGYLQTLPEVERETLIYEYQEKKEEEKERRQAEEDLLLKKQNEEKQRQQQEEKEKQRQKQKQKEAAAGTTKFNFLQKRISQSKEQQTIKKKDGKKGDDARTQSQQHSQEQGQGSMHLSPVSKAMTGTRNRELELKDLRACQLTRSSLETVVNEPYFKEFVSGLFAIYRLCEIECATKYPKAYSLSNSDNNNNSSNSNSNNLSSGKVTQNAIVAKFGNQKRTFRVTAASNQPFTASEFEKWKQQMEADRCTLPLPKQLEDRTLRSQMRRHTYRYDMKDLVSMHNERQLRDFANKQNLTKLRLQIQHRLDSLADNNPDKASLTFSLKQIDDELEKRRLQRKSTTMIESINEQNRRNNLLRRSIHRKLFIGPGQGNTDPFSRTITKSTIERFGENSTSDVKAKKEKDYSNESKNKKDKEIKAEAETHIEIKHETNTEKDVQSPVQANSINKKKLGKHNRLFESSAPHWSNIDITEILSKNAPQIKEEAHVLPLTEPSQSNEDHDSLIRDPLWLVIHDVGANFCKDIHEVDLPIRRSGVPIFGRNSNPTSYANEFLQQPTHRHILSLQDYFQLKHKGLLKTNALALFTTLNFFSIGTKNKSFLFLHRFNFHQLFAVLQHHAQFVRLSIFYCLCLLKFEFKFAYSSTGNLAFKFLYLSIDIQISKYIESVTTIIFIWMDPMLILIYY
ncbi:Plus-3 domain containing protein [Reticulomyxa filosa]|uniref:Plus-3 domain containing protein n=1 Tax=Reticulomyxa filosa TaxID=46433 RepID=X6N3X3_RETFI|nr:Plus-3 domain containing protein [Reticulomyxa filosa]|eukprot:ETO20007.1 Plus-3 domain containing protein [Reticulomyxa filosa]